MKVNELKHDYEFVVVGGGMSGICAAIAAARGGVRTALVHDRPVLGGNASSEIRMHICGADRHGGRDHARETGIIEEILLENTYRNPQNGYPIWDTILWEKVHFQDNLTLYLNTHMTDVFTENGNIKAISARQLTNETLLHIKGKYFADTTGDGSLAHLAGATYMMGREARSTYKEQHAPEIADNVCMGNTLLFKSVDMGKPMNFIRPEWANVYTEEDLVHRDHGAYGYNYWWIELGGDELNTISHSESIRDELLKATYGVWDHIKNGGDHQAQNYVLDWMGFLPGKRESRRIIGDYVLTENDLAKSMSVSASSSTKETPPANVINGFQRTVHQTLNHWESLSEDSPWLMLKANEPVNINTLDLKFDSNLSKEIRMSMFDKQYEGYKSATPESLVKDYSIEFFLKGQIIDQIEITDNHYRLRSHKLSQTILCDQVKLTCCKTHGDDHFKLYEVRLYED